MPSRNPVHLLEAIALTVLVFATFLISGPGRAEALTNCTVSASDLAFDAEEQDFLARLNAYRAQHGAGPLTASANLNRSAAWKARDLVIPGHVFDHTDSLGRDVLTRMQQCDAIAPGATIAENIAGGPSSTGADILIQWENSPPHNATMLNPAYVQIGIGRAFDAGNQYPWMWATNFSTVDDGTRVGGPTGPVSNPITNFDSPQNGVVPASFRISGWTLDRGATADDGVDVVTIGVYQLNGSGVEIQPPAFQTTTAFPKSRPDVANAFGANFVNSGFDVTTPTLPAGNYRVYVSAHSTISGAINQAIRNVTIQGPQSIPRINLDNPPAGNAPGSFLAYGWAIDQGATSGTGVDRVDMYIYPTDANGNTTGSQVFFGGATLNGDRPDVGNVYGAQFRPSGFSVNVPQLQSGNYLIIVYSHSTVNQQWASLTRRISVPGPLMSIDSPGASATTSGFLVSGWAIDRASVSNTGVDRIDVYLYKLDANGNQTQPVAYFGGATLRGDRPDVAAAYGQQFRYSGYSVVVPRQTAGTYQLIVYMHSSVSNAWSALTRNVAVGAGAASPDTAQSIAGQVPEPVAGPGSSAPAAPPQQAPVQAPPAPQAVPAQTGKGS